MGWGGGGLVEFWELYLFYKYISIYKGHGGFVYVL